MASILAENSYIFQYQSRTWKAYFSYQIFLKVAGINAHETNIKY